MAQTGFTPIVTYNTATATTVPSAANLAQGELAVNVTDKKLYTKDSGGNVVLLASNGGDVTGPASSTNLAIPTFSGTGGKTLLDNAGATISAGVITATGFSGPLTGNVTGNVSGSSGSCTGNASTVTTNANLTGPITSVGNATSIASQTGTGTKFVVDTSPTLVTPVLGVATATSINKMAITAPATSSTLAIADGKTHTVNNSIALSGTDSTTMTFPTTSATIARTDAAQTFTGIQTISSAAAANVLRLKGGVGTDNCFMSFSGNSTAGDLYYVGINLTTNGIGANLDFYDNAASANRMRINSAGIVSMPVYGAGAATFSAAGVISSVSDETWKTKDGVPLNPDAMLQKLEPGYWYYNDEKKEIFGADRQLGFYAQNVNYAIGVEAAPIPETYTEIDANGVEVTKTKPWGYYDRSVLAVTVMSLQKALATIESLTARIELLEGK